MNEENYFELNDVPASEINKLADENNTINLKNDYENTVTYEQTNNYQTKKITNNSFDKLKLISTFVVAVAVTMIIQTVFNVSILSPIPPPKLYAIESIDSTYKSISYSVKLTNIDDFWKNEYSLLLVKNGCDTDDYIISIPFTVKEANKIKIFTNTATGTFDKCATVTDEKDLAPNTNYVLLILKNEKIVQKKNILTKNFNYIVSVTFDNKVAPTIKTLFIKATINEKWSKYDKICYELTNLSTDAKLRYFVPKASIGTYAEFGIDITYPVEQYRLSIYCLTDSPDSLYYTDSFDYADGRYYLIYTHSTLINF